MLLTAVFTINIFMMCYRSGRTFLSFISHIPVTRASREGSEDPGWGGHVSDRKKSPGPIAEEELLQWRSSLFHGDSTKCDGHLQKSNLHPSSRRRAGKPSLLLIPLNPQSILNFPSHTHNTPEKGKELHFLQHGLWITMDYHSITATVAWNRILFWVFCSI